MRIPIKVLLGFVFSISSFYIILPGIAKVIDDSNSQLFADDIELVSFDTTWTSPYVVDPDHPFHFKNNENQHLYLLSKVAFGYFACEFPEKFLEKVRQEKVNVLRVCLEGIPCPGSKSYDMWPWAGSRTNPNWNQFDNAYWQLVEDRIRLAGTYGVGFDIVLYHDVFPSIDQATVQKKYWEEIIARLAKFANVFTWEITHEYDQNESFQDKAAIFFKNEDPYHRPVISSAGTPDNASWLTKDWMDMAVMHTNTGNQEAYDLENWYLSTARKLRAYRKPVFNNQSGKENVHGNNEPIHRRKQQWLWSMTGGFWSWNSYEGCEKIDDHYYYGAGWQYLSSLYNFFSEIPFWQLAPDTRIIQYNNDLIHTSLYDPISNTFASYSCSRTQGDYVRNNSISLRLPEGHYEVKFLRPSDLREHSSIEILSSGSSDVLEINLPDFQDDLLIKATEINPQ